MKQGEDGYILASAIGMLAAISVVAAALVGASAEALTRVKRAEADAASEAVLQAALTIVGSQLVLDPRRRALDLEGDTLAIDVLGQPIRFQLGWESNKLDLNLAQAASIEAALDAGDVIEGTRAKVLAAIRMSRSTARPLRLLGDLKIDRGEEDCLTSFLTVFGGRAEYDPENAGDTSLVGRPAAGSRIAIDLAVKDQEADGLSVVVLVTGDPAAAIKVMDWRRSSRLAGEVCHEAST